MSAQPAPTPNRERGGEQFGATNSMQPKNPVLKLLCSGSSQRASSSQTINRRAKSSDTFKPLPVTAIKAVLFSGTICVRPRRRTRAGRSVNTEANVSDRRSELLTLSTNSTGAASIRSGARRLSSSCRSPPFVNAWGRIPKAIAQRQRTVALFRCRHPKFPVP